MADNQHRLITGYRELSTREIDLMNEIKAEGVRLEALIVKLREAVDAEPPIEIDQRWVSIGATDLQTGLMALTRSIAKPTTF